MDTPPLLWSGCSYSPAAAHAHLWWHSAVSWHLAGMLLTAEEKLDDQGSEWSIQWRTWSGAPILTSREDGFPQREMLTLWKGAKGILFSSYISKQATGSEGEQLTSGDSCPLAVTNPESTRANFSQEQARGRSRDPLPCWAGLSLRVSVRTHQSNRNGAVASSSKVSEAVGDAPLLSG